MEAVEQRAHARPDDHALASMPTDAAYVDYRRLFAGRLLHLLQDFVQVEGGRLLPLRVLSERRQELADESLSWYEHERVIEDPIVVGVRGDVCPLVGIRPEVIELREPQGHERL